MKDIPDHNKVLRISKEKRYPSKGVETWRQFGDPYQVLTRHTQLVTPTHHAQEIEVT